MGANNVKSVKDALDNQDYERLKKIYKICGSFEYQERNEIVNMIRNSKDISVLNIFRINIDVKDINDYDYIRNLLTHHRVETINIDKVKWIIEEAYKRKDKQIFSLISDHIEKRSIYSTSYEEPFTTLGKSFINDNNYNLILWSDRGEFTDLFHSMVTYEIWKKYYDQGKNVDNGILEQTVKNKDGGIFQELFAKYIPDVNNVTEEILDKYYQLAINSFSQENIVYLAELYEPRQQDIKVESNTLPPSYDSITCEQPKVNKGLLFAFNSRNSNSLEYFLSLHPSTDNKIILETYRVCYKMISFDNNKYYFLELTLIDRVKQDDENRGELANIIYNVIENHNSMCCENWDRYNKRIEVMKFVLENSTKLTKLEQRKLEDCILGVNNNSCGSRRY